MICTELKQTSFISKQLSIVSQELDWIKQHSSRNFYKTVMEKNKIQFLVAKLRWMFRFIYYSGYRCLPAHSVYVPVQKVYSESVETVGQECASQSFNLARERFYFFRVRAHMVYKYKCETRKSIVSHELHGAVSDMIHFTWLWFEFIFNASCQILCVRDQKITSFIFM